ncbi:hypothetical protein ACSAZK_03105 [Methanosarcina sp. Mfa9]|uniref:hypothetical protein n=1 Tax=Methanosarcina sp. Mfa9 TaxID=3439063 RepID=UPI003F87E926
MKATGTFSNIREFLLDSSGSWTIARILNLVTMTAAFMVIRNSGFTHWVFILAALILSFVFAALHVQTVKDNEEA